MCGLVKVEASLYLSSSIYIYVNQVLLVLTTPTQMWDAATVSCLRLPRLSSTLL